MANRKLSALGVCTALFLFASQAQAAPIAAGQQISGTLSASDQHLADNSYADNYEFRGRAGQHVRIDMRSSAFDTFLVVNGPGNFSQSNDDVSSGNTNSQLDITLPADGVYTIQANSLAPQTTGAYTVSVTDLGTQSATATGSGASAPGAIAFGQSANGELRSGDSTLQSGEFADSYTFRGRAGQRIDVTMQSTEFDPYVMVRGNGVNEDNDDAAPGDTQHSHLVVTLPADGDYTITATSFQSGEHGRYQLAVGPAGATADTASSGRADDSNAASLTLGRAQSGELRTGDRTLNTGEFYDAYTFHGRAGQRIDVSMQSQDFDPYIMVRGNGVSEDNDDATPGDTHHSHLVVTLPADGDYTISATSYTSGMSGRYQLTVGNAGGSAPAQNQTADLSGGGSPPLTAGTPVSGALQASDQQISGTGEFIDVYRFLGQRGQHVIIDMSSNDFHPYVMLRLGDRQLGDNDSNAGRTAQVDTVLPEDGEYVVGATSHARGETGAYHLTLNTTDEGGSVAVAETPHGGAGNGPPLPLGRAVEGNLQNGDTTLSSGQFADTWSFQGHRGQAVAFDLTSEAIDPYLIVTSPSGQTRDNDDMSDSNRNSHVSWRLPEDGVYSITATSYGEGEHGAYSLRAAIETAAAATQRGGNGRVHAVIVGISDYPGEQNDLPFTADDARNMEHALRQEGVLTGDSVVLTDGQATVANVRAAFQRVAANAGPDDMFLFFYSGHGDQGDVGTAPNQADRRMESIVLHDAEVSAATMSQWFEGVHARLGLIALDSCFSGGFRTVISRPGLMGLFSSEEDLTSGVAGKFQAGGYLSHFLTTAMSGEADDDGDHKITAGELSDYLWRKFATEVDNEQAWTINHQRNYQRLVVERGGTKVDDVVIALNN
ncbi:MAG: caspase family protein [Terricaulis sp.]